MIVKKEEEGEGEEEKGEEKEESYCILCIDNMSHKINYYNNDTNSDNNDDSHN